MSKDLKTLQAALEPKQARLKELDEQVIAGAITDTEMGELRTLTTEVEETVADIELLQRSVDRAKGKARAAFRTPEQKLAERVTISDMARQLTKRNAPLEGAVLEMHQEGMKEMRSAQIPQMSDGIAIPSWIHDSQNRGVDAATAATASNLIPTLQQGFTPALRPQHVLEQLGATFLRGLNGILEFPAGNGLATSSYNTETGAASETTPTTKKPTMTPKRQATWSKSTMQLIEQSSVSVAAWLESDILDAEMRKLNEVAILGGGTNEPTGILSMTTGAGNINLKKIGADANTGAAITRAFILELEELLANAYANTNPDMCKILTTNGVKRVLKNLPSADGIAPFVWENNNTIVGYNAYASTLVPKTLDIGTTTGVGNAMIMGDFSKLLVGLWGVRYLTVDNITAAKTGEIEIILNSFSDVQVIHKQAFAVIKDITIA